MNSPFTIPEIRKGGEVTTIFAPLKVHAFKDLSNYSDIRDIIIKEHANKKSDQEIAAILTEKNFTTPSLRPITGEVIQRWRLSHRIIRPRGGKQSMQIKGYLTIRQLCDLFNLQRYWISDRIYNGKIKTHPDEQQGIYIFPDTEKTKEQFKLFIEGKLNTLNFLEGY